MIDLSTLTIVKARAALDAGEFSAVDLAQAYLAEIEKKNGELNVYREVFADVLDQAKAADELLAKNKDDGKNGNMPLLGIPFAIKDNILISGRIAGASSKMLEKYVASYDATAITKLKNAGAIFLGRTNMDEFAMGGSTENSAYGPTRNPHDSTRIAGGSSGGSVAAVAAHMCLAALGSDTGGSIRQPAAFCGVVGLKPTYGAISRSGLMAMGSSLDCIGPITNTVEDAEIVDRIIRGQDPLDSTTISESTYTARTNGKKIGIPRDLVNGEGIDPVIKANFDATVERFRNAGYEISDVSLPNIGLGLAIYYIVMPAEVSSNLARFDGVKYGLHVDGKDLLEDYLLTRGTGFGPEARRRILLGTYVLSSGYYDAYYGKAEMARNLLRAEFEAAFESVDLILTPTSPILPWKIGEKSDPLSVYLADVFTVTANIVGVPAISVPSGFVEVEGKTAPVRLPLGVQFMAAHGNEQALFEAGKALGL